MTIRIGFVGLSKSGGWAALGLAPPLFSEPLNSQYSLVALSTSSSTSASESAKHFSELASTTVRAYHGPTDAIAANDELDLVAVSVNPPSHRTAVLPLLEKGRNVYVEWPVGNTINETKEFVAKAQEKGVRTIVGLQGWQTPVVRRIREIIAEGKIGTVFNVTWIASKLSFPPYWTPFVMSSAEYLTDPDQGATLTNIWLGHNLSMITRALGPLASLSAVSTIGIPVIKVGESPMDPKAKSVQAKVPDQYAVSGTFESGALFSGSWRTIPIDTKNTTPTLVWLIEGSKGQLRVETSADTPVGGFPHFVPPVALFFNGEKIALEEENAQFGGATGRAWVEYARGDEGEYPTFEDALLLRKHVEAVKRSMVEGIRVPVNDV
ncbi:NAD-binding Rossmann fold oxidoreductase [Peniophora sp. CONT]|nr:NAD-binding Rossmann fold oxidoreductase [Peniophora sp. CONT]